MAIQTIKATLQMRRGLEQDFDADQMVAGEWAVSTDTKYVRMCFMPGLCLRMATYESFEQDMEEIRTIIIEARDIQKAVEEWYKLSESYAHGGTGARQGEDIDNAKYYSEQAKISADNAEAVSGIGIMTTEKSGIGKPDGKTIIVDADGTMHVVANDSEKDFASKDIYGDTSVNMGRKEGSTVGNLSFAFGRNAEASGERAISFGKDNIASGNNSFACGSNTIASGNTSFSEGFETKAIGSNSHSEGSGCNSYRSYSHSEGNNTTAFGISSHSSGAGTVSVGYASHSEGMQTISGNGYILLVKSVEVSSKKITFSETYDNFTEAFSKISAGVKIHVINIYYIDTANIFTVKSIDASDNSVIVEEDIPSTKFTPWLAVLSVSNNTYASSHSEGKRTVSNGINSHAEGEATIASASYSHAEGKGTVASGTASHAEGYETKANDSYAHAEGIETEAGFEAHSEGLRTVASGIRSHTEGYRTEALADQHAQGHFNDISKATAGVISGTSSGTAFVIGNGNSNTPSNAARIDYNGKLWCKEAYSSTGADYAELFEWSDGNQNNEDRRGYFVTVEGKKIKKAQSGDYIVGIISGNPSVIGNTDMEWYGQFVRDEFGTLIKETHKETIKDILVDESGASIEEEKEVDVEFYKVSPDYDPDVPYTFRLDRPEWEAVGMIGVLPVRDDGTCKVGKFCRCTDGGIATIAMDRGFDTYMVIERVSENIVSVILK